MNSISNISKTADELIFECIQPNALKSFFLFAGAGSGKTRSLVNALQRFRSEFGINFRLQHKKIAVITYTNAASNEILHRIEYDPLFSISTIHHFCWELIRPFQHDIRVWRENELKAEIETLEGQLKTGRQGKTAEDRRNRIDQLQQRLQQLPEIRKFTYNPNGDNRTRDSLNHSQVIKIAADFLRNKTLMQSILINKFPIIFIDEAQDTKKDLIDVMFEIQQIHATRFALGLFGDTMQRIYLDGKEKLGMNLPQDWIVPEKTVNHRCPRRVVDLINQLRLPVDKRRQEPAPGKSEGFARLFIVSSTQANKAEVEQKVCNLMSGITNDTEWNSSGVVKKLILEHHMAANRLGFANLYEALSTPESYKTGLGDGTLPSIQVFSKAVLPLITAHKNNDAYDVMRIVKQYSPLMSPELIKSSENQLRFLESVRQKVEKLTDLWESTNIPTLGDVAQGLKVSGLFSLPDIIEIILARSGDEPMPENHVDINTEKRQEEIEAWESALSCPFSEIAQYQTYITETSGFGTHQGVKGLQFPRVMVILDDDSARGNLFKYEKLFGVESLSDRDLANQAEGKDTSVDRTLRLFYVACSRAEESLAIVAYTNDTDALFRNAITHEWFAETEIGII